MHYEYLIREKACSFMNNGCMANGYVKMDIASALTKAQLCPDLRGKEFLEKLVCQVPGSASSSHAAPLDGLTKAQRRIAEKAAKVKGGGKGGKNGDGLSKTMPKVNDKKPKGGKHPKGAGKGKRNRLNTKHNGKEICLAFQEGHCKGTCGREHVCQICGDKHVTDVCPNKVA